MWHLPTGQIWCIPEVWSPRIIQCLSPAKKYKLYKSSINKSLHFAQRSLSSSTRVQRENLVPVPGNAEKVPFLVKVSISDLNIRKGPGTDYGRVQFCPVGVYTIVEVKSGKGASAWGRLKSGIGWISLDFVKRV